MGKLAELLRQLFNSRIQAAKSGLGTNVAHRTVIIGAIVSAVGVFYVVVNGAIGTLNFLTNDWLDIRYVLVCPTTDTDLFSRVDHSAGRPGNSGLPLSLTESRHHNRRKWVVIWNFDS